MRGPGLLEMGGSADIDADGDCSYDDLGDLGGRPTGKRIELDNEQMYMCNMKLSAELREKSWRGER